MISGEPLFLRACVNYSCFIFVSGWKRWSWFSRSSWRTRDDGEYREIFTVKSGVPQINFCIMCILTSSLLVETFQWPTDLVAFFFLQFLYFPNYIYPNLPGQRLYGEDRSTRKNPELSAELRLTLFTLARSDNWTYDLRGEKRLPWKTKQYPKLAWQWRSVS